MNLKRTILFLLLGLLLTTLSLRAQSVALKTNTLYWATSTPNIGLEFRTGLRTSISLFGGYNPFDFSSYERDDGAKVYPMLRNWVVMPEFKYWFCRAFEQNYIGLHAIYGEYNIGGLSFIKDLADYRYQGDVYGGGLSWGYQWALGERFGLEVSLGVGYLRLHYKKYDSAECGTLLGDFSRDFFGPTKAALSISYYIK